MALANGGGNDPAETLADITRLLGDARCRLIACLHDSIVDETSRFWRARNGRTILLPLTTQAVSSPTARGSDSLPVSISIDGHSVYLADSMQFMLELALRVVGGPVYYVMPSFRGESADESHLPQFFHSEAEIEGGLGDILRIGEAYVRALVQRLRTDYAEDIAKVAGTAEHLDVLLSSRPFAQITFDDAARLVPQDVEVHSGWRTLSRRGELRLMELLGTPLWLTHFDHLAVPFYQAFADQDRLLAANADLLLGVGEVIGAGARHSTAEDLEAAFELHVVSAKTYGWYREMKRRAPLATAGFGMGIERFLMWVLKGDDIRDMQFLRRDVPSGGCV